MHNIHNRITLTLESVIFLNMKCESPDSKNMKAQKGDFVREPCVCRLVLIIFC